MAIKKKLDNVVAAHRLMESAKLGKMADDEKFAVIKIARVLKKSGTDFEDLLKDAQEKLKPEGMSDIVVKIQGQKPLTHEESLIVEKYNKDVSACVSEELDKEIELDFAPLSEEAFGRFVASNDFSIKDTLIISDVICD